MMIVYNNLRLKQKTNQELVNSGLIVNMRQWTNVIKIASCNFKHLHIIKIVAGSN
uniref:Uncharacterized protein n=1 Tax=Octopus bimaculoides TaxID=37653 RepID=A0A0L8GEB3_OCTBM